MTGIRRRLGHRKQALLLAVPFFICATLCVTVATYIGGETIRDGVRRDLSEIAHAASLLTDGDLHERLVHPGQKNSEEYRKVQVPYRAMLKADPHLRYIYTAVLRDGKVYFIIDTKQRVHEVVYAPDDRETTADIMEEYPDATPAFREALERQVPLVEKQPYTDEWGKFLSAYAPIYNSRNEFIGIVGVDIDAAYFESTIRTIWSAGAIGVLLGMLFAIVAYLGMSRQLMISEELRRAKEAAELASREQSRRLSNIIDYAVDGLITISEQGVIESFNPAAERIFGYAQAEVLGRDVEILMPGIHAGGPEGHSRDGGQPRRFLAVGGENEFQGRRKDGGEFPLSLGVSEIRMDDGRRIYSGIIRDISISRLMERNLRESRERFQLAIAGSNNGIWDWDIITGDAYFSPRFKSLMGFEEHEIAGRFSEWSERLHPEDAERILGLLQAHLRERTGAYDVEYRLKIKSGEWRWFRTKGQALWDEHGAPLRMAGSLSDISKRKAAEEELVIAKERAESMAAELAAAIRTAEMERLKAEQATSLKSEFLANMSHEIRTPMNGIIGMSTLLLDTPLDATQKAYINMVIHSSEALLQIINDILDFSKIEAGKMEMESISFDFQLLMEEVADMMALKAHEKKIELLLRYPPDMPRFVRGDPGRVRQIFFNLISNAIKFTAEGHVLIHVEAHLGEDETAHYRIRIEDTGIGIPDDKLTYIFNKFTQADGSTTRKFGGTGLGLAICRQLVGMMGGEIGVESEWGSGSVFWFTLVLPYDDAVAIVPPIPADALKGMRVLAVDDNEASRALVLDQLRAAEAVAYGAASGAEALERMRSMAAEGAPVELAVIDYLMPEMDGAELARAIKSDASLAGTILMVLTSVPLRGDGAWLWEAGFSGYLPKPYNASDMIAMLSLLRRGEPEKLLTRYSIKEYNRFARRAGVDKVRFAGAQVLVVEDNIVNQHVATSLLSRFGCLVTIADDGEEALKWAKERRFDLILMDCQMPVMDGYEAAQAIRRWEGEQGAARVPIVALTANAMKGDDEKCFAMGMDGYLPKPVKMDALEAVLLRWLPPEKQESSAAS